MNQLSLFCDNTELIEKNSQLIGEYLLGKDTITKVKLRYDDLKANFNAVTFDEWDGSGKYPLWKFSSGLTPYMDYDDTSTVPIPFSNKLFKTQNTIVSFDFPVWFNLGADTARRVLFISQDPIPRSIKWYQNCEDALCSTVFGLHNPLWREKGNGGKRMWLLIQALVENGCGVYITDSHKLAIQSRDGEILNPTESQTAVYRDLLKAEIDMIKPRLIVTFGNIAGSMMDFIATQEVPVLNLPHFSGLSQGKIKKYFNWPEEKQFPIEDQATCYSKTIIKNIPL